MRVAKNISLLLFVFYSCVGQEQKFKNTEEISINFYISNDSTSTFLNLKSHHFDNRLERCYSAYHINNLIFSEHAINDLTFQILEGEFKISAGAVGKEWIDLEKLKINKGDSISIKFYLKDDLEVLHKY